MTDSESPILWTGKYLDGTLTISRSPKVTCLFIFQSTSVDIGLEVTFSSDPNEQQLRGAIAEFNAIYYEEEIKERDKNGIALS